MRMTIEGHTYRERIEIASFGEERPACQGTTDDCRARNRRDEFCIPAGEPVAVQR
jgi:outer membrane protein OmpA-like peptidoglycan-associated protein